VQVGSQVLCVHLSQTVLPLPYQTVLPAIKILISNSAACQLPYQTVLPSYSIQCTLHFGIRVGVRLGLCQTSQPKVSSGSEISVSRIPHIILGSEKVMSNSVTAKWWVLRDLLTCRDEKYLRILI
jgi:hypothetical protein